MIKIRTHIKYFFVYNLNVWDSYLRRFFNGLFYTDYLLSNKESRKKGWNKFQTKHFDTNYWSEQNNFRLIENISQKGWLFISESDILNTMSFALGGNEYGYF